MKSHRQRSSFPGGAWHICLLAAMAACFALSLCLLGCSGAQSAGGTGLSSLQAPADKPSALQIDYLFSLSPNELEEYLTSSGYDYLELDDVIERGPSEELSVSDIVEAQLFGNSWYPKWYADSKKSGSWPDGEEEKSLLQDTAVGGYIVGVSAYDEETANGSAEAFADNPIWDVEHRLNRDRLRNNESFLCIKVRIIDPSPNQANVTAESVEQEVNRIQELTQLDPPLHHSVWHHENTPGLVDDYFSAYNMGTCSVNGTECFYILLYGSASSEQELSIWSLDHMLQVTGTTNVSDLINASIDRNALGDRVI